MSIPTFRAATLRLRPVWTITWRDLSAPSLRKGTPHVTEEDMWHNKQVASDYYDEHGLRHLDEVTAHIKTTDAVLDYRASHPAYS